MIIGIGVKIEFVVAKVNEVPSMDVIDVAIAIIIFIVAGDFFGVGVSERLEAFVTQGEPLVNYRLMGVMLVMRSCTCCQPIS